MRHDQRTICSRTIFTLTLSIIGVLMVSESLRSAPWRRVARAKRGKLHSLNHRKDYQVCLLIRRTVASGRTAPFATACNCA